MQKFHQVKSVLYALLWIVSGHTLGQDISQFETVKSRVFAQPYLELPYYKVRKRNFGKAGDHPDNHLLNAARRTLQSKADFIDRPEGQKLLNANGICFAGRWEITQASDFTGLFVQNTSVPVIVRASVALSGTRQKHKRAFGMAIKLFPDDKATSRNFFVLNSLAGVRTQHVLDLTLDNEPSTNSFPPLAQLSTALRLRNDLSRADKEQGIGEAQLAYRTVNHIAKPIQTERSTTQTVQSAEPTLTAPYWLRLRAADTLPRIDADDFRDELAVKHYPEHTLTWRIEVAPYSLGINKKAADWQWLGQLILNESVTSKACDVDLHFAHPVTQAARQ